MIIAYTIKAIIKRILSYPTDEDKNISKRIMWKSILAFLRNPNKLSDSVIIPFLAT